MISTSQTQVVRPRCRRRATAWIVPSTIGRRKLVWLERPCAVWPRSWTANQVAIEVIDSAIEAKTPPWTRPAGWRELVADGDLRADLLVGQRRRSAGRTRPSKPGSSRQGSGGVFTRRTLTGASRGQPADPATVPGLMGRWPARAPRPRPARGRLAGPPAGALLRRDRRAAGHRPSTPSAPAPTPASPRWRRANGLPRGDHRPARRLPARPAAAARRRGDPRPAGRVRPRPRLGAPAWPTQLAAVAPGPLPEVPGAEARGRGRARRAAAARRPTPRRRPHRPPPSRRAGPRGRRADAPSAAAPPPARVAARRRAADRRRARRRRRRAVPRPARRRRRRRPDRRRRRPPRRRPRPRPPPPTPAQVADEIPLRRRRRQGQGHDDRLPPGRSAPVRARGRRTCRRARGSKPYAVWLQKGDKARRLGFAEPVGEDGSLAVRGPSEDLRATSRSSTRPTTGSSSRRRRRTGRDAPTSVVLSGQAAQRACARSRAAASPGS